MIHTIFILCAKVCHRLHARSYYIHAYPIAPGANATMVFLKGKSPNINGDMVVLCDIESQEMLRFVHVVLGARQSADEQRSALCAMQFSLTY